MPIMHVHTYKTTLPYRLRLRCHCAHIYYGHLPATSETRAEINRESERDDGRSREETEKYKYSGKHDV